MALPNDVVSLLLSDMDAVTRPPETAHDFYTLPGGALAQEGDSITFELSGGFAGAADTEVEILLTEVGGVEQASANIFQTGVVDPSASSDWVIRGRIVRTDADHAKCIGTLVGGGLTKIYLATINLDLSKPLTFSIVQSGTDDLSLASAHLTYWAA